LPADESTDLGAADPGETVGWRRWALIAAACFALIAATRWPLVPTRHLYHIDNVNFALALDDFNPALHQPQPPGDPMYVALTRGMRPFTPRVEILFPVSGILGSAAAMAALWWVGEMLFGARAGWVAALLLALNPVFWLAGVGNYVRVYLALGSATVAGLVWKSLVSKSQSQSATYFCASAAALGLFAGFRPEMSLLLAPLVFLPHAGLIPALGRRAPLWNWVAAAGCAAATTLPWLLITAEHTGGLARLYQLNRHFLATQSRHYSLFYGATVREALRMAAASIYWIFLGAVPWAAFVPLAWHHSREDRISRSLAFWLLAFWFVPPFLFFTFVYIEMPDCALVAIPAVALAGAWTLTRLPARWFWWAAPAALAATVVLFFYPTQSPFWASNYRIAEYTMRSAEQIYSRVGLLRKTGPVTVLYLGAYITPREIGYYFPGVPIVNFEAHPPFVQLGNRFQPALIENGDLILPAGQVIWLDPVSKASAGVFDGLRQAAGGELGSEGPVHWANLQPGVRFTVGAQRIRVGAQAR
jgi:hypothetical protein